METVRVDVVYRPIRIGWAIQNGDLEAFRTAVQVSFSFWGGRFNPILIIDNEDEARSLVEVFKVDVIVPVGNSEAVRAFPNKFPHLISPFFPDELFMESGDGGGACHLLDIENALTYANESRAVQDLKNLKFRLYKWDPGDPLGDIFLMHFGAYASQKITHSDYLQMFRNAVEPKEITVAPGTKLDADSFDHPSISYLSRHSLERDYRSRSGWETPGFFVGAADDLQDLACCWNLRAADIPVLFIDPRYLDRFDEGAKAWAAVMEKMVADRRHEFQRRLAVWMRGGQEFDPKRGQTQLELMRRFSGKIAEMVPVGEGSWNGLNIRPPMMHLGQVASLGILDSEDKRPKISFSLDDKPFSSEFWFHTQHLITSLSFIGGLYRDEQHTLVPPFIPELNEFYARTIHFDYNKLRSEPERIGIVVNVRENSLSLRALPISELFDRIFDLSGMSTKLSNAGLIARQLITQLGGVDGARVFKIPGVRRLLKTYGPTEPFTQKSAIQLIGRRDPDNPGASFKDHENLFIEPRPHSTKLTPSAVFAYLVEKRLFRIGAELTCPNCNMKTWTALDSLRQQLVCELCGHDFDATRQLVRGAWCYRRSGVMGSERNVQGAIPVVLTLQQLQINLQGMFREGMYSPSLEVVAKDGSDSPKCEVDFVWLMPDVHSTTTDIILGECKDKGADRQNSSINEADIRNLRHVAERLPKRRFRVFYMLTKLSRFTPEEIELAKQLNDPYHQRVILLTERELEPYHLFERTKKEFPDIKDYASRPEELAAITTHLYFKERN